MIPAVTVTATPTPAGAVVVATSGNRSCTYTITETDGSYKIVEHGCAFSLPLSAVALAARLAVDGLR